MTTVRRLKIVCAALAATVVLTCSQVWGDPARDLKGKVLTGNSSPAPAGAPGARPANLEQELAENKFSRLPLVVYQTVKGQTLFALQVQPTLEAAPARPRDWVLLIDSSASQAGTSWLAARAIAEELPKVVPANDRIAILTANIPAASKNLSGGLQSPASPQLKVAFETLARETPLGSTDLKDAVAKALEVFKKDFQAGRQRVLLFLGDGMSNQNQLTNEERHRLCLEMVKNEIAFFPVPMGIRLDPANLNGFAAGTGGAVVRLKNGEKVEQSLGRIFDSVKAPILYPTKFQLSAEVAEFFPTKLPPLRSDSPTLVVGTIKPAASLTYLVDGTVAGKPVQVKKTETMPESELDHYFLLSIVDQWKKKGDFAEMPAMIRSDRALVMAQARNQMAKEELKAQAEWALTADKLDEAGKLFADARRVDPHDDEAAAGMRLVEKMKAGLINRKQLEERATKAGDKGMKISGKGKVKAGEMFALLQEMEKKNGNKMPAADPVAQPNFNPNNPNLAPAFENENLIRLQKQRMAVEEQRVTQVVDEAIRQARRLLALDPEQAKEILKRTREGVRDNNDLGPITKTNLVNQLETTLRSVEIQGIRVVEQREIALRQQAQNVRVLNDLLAKAGEDEKNKRRQMAFNDLMNRGRFEDAWREAVQMQNDAIARGQVPSTSMVASRFEGEMGTNIREAKEIRRQIEERYMLAMLQVDKSAIPFPEEPPIEFPPAAIWRELSKRRKDRYDFSNLDGETPKSMRDLRDVLHTPMTQLRAKPLNGEISFDEGTQLKDALGVLSDIFSTPEMPLEFVIDDAAFKAEAPEVNVETLPVKLRKMRNVTIATVLRILTSQLQPQGTYLIQRDGPHVLITTGTRALIDKQVRAYPVAELVVPIPNAINQVATNQNLQMYQQVLTIAGSGFGTIGTFNFGGGGAPIAGFQGGLGGFGGGLGGLGGLGGVQGGGFQGNLGFAGAGQGVAGGVLGFGGGTLGQYGNLGGQFGLQGGDTSGILIAMVKGVIAPGEWRTIPGLDSSSGLPQGAVPDEPPIVDFNMLNALGYYNPSRALVVRGSSRIHTRVDTILNRGLVPPAGGGAMAPKNNNGPNALVKNNDPQPKVIVGKNADPKAKPVPPVPLKPELVKNDLDAKKVWQDALAKGPTEPGLIIATADFLVQCGKFEHAAELLKANLRQGIIVRPWVYEALALALQGSKGNLEDIERCQVSAIDLDAQDAMGYLRASQAMAGHKRYDRAVAFCRQAAQLEPNLPDAYADALAYAELSQDSEAMTWAASNLLQRDWPLDPGLHARARDKAGNMARALETSRKAEADKLRQTVQQVQRRDLIIKLTWAEGETGADLDLKVKEPIGTTCSHLQRQSPGGGTLIGDALTREKLEQYVAEEAFSGVYTVTIERVWGRPLGAKASLEIIRNAGTPQETREPQTIIFDRSHEVKVVLQSGRRTSVAAVPPAPIPTRRETETSSASEGNRVFSKLRALADPAQSPGSPSGLRGGLTSTGIIAPTRPASVQPLAASNAEEVTMQTKLNTFLKSGLDLTAQAVVSPDGSSVRLSVSPVFQTANRAPSAAVTNPLIPGGN